MVCDAFYQEGWIICWNVLANRRHPLIGPCCETLRITWRCVFEEDSMTLDSHEWAGLKLTFHKRPLRGAGVHGL